MAGLLGDVLPWVYSQGDRAKRFLGGLLSDPVGSAQQTAGLLGDKHREMQALQAQAFPDQSRPFKVGDSKALGQMADAMLTGPLGFAPAGITVWHGSPHKFDKFDSSKIGTGEGAQAYGHGLYLAESKDLADVYRKKLTGVDGAAVGHPDHSLQVKIGQLQNQIQQLRQSDNPAAASMIRAYESRISELNNAGSLYKVDLPDEQVAKMLDWDKPLSQQAPIIQEAMKHKPPVYSGSEYTADELLNAMMTGKELQPRQQLVQPEKISPLSQALGAFREKTVSTKPPTGEQVYRALADQYGHEKAAAMMREAGIPGIKYLDGGSRGAGGGTSNFVVFPGNEGLLSILERNGQPIR